MTKAAERKALAEGLGRLNENMVTLAEISELAIRKAVDGLSRIDHDVAREVFVLDQEIYALQNEIEKTCVDLIALHAPVARDLRTITTSLKITTDLDRIGRYAKDIAETTLLFDPNVKHFKKLVSIPHMAEMTIHMVDTSIEAFVKRDADSVRNISEVDDSVDSLNDEVFREIVTYMMDASLTIEVGARYILVSRYLERIADHAVNIGERVVYMVTGERLPRLRAADREKPGIP
ncbi:MAG: phosphate transport system regulatory protein PhoU [Euryarchaeota archaeon RBG_16_68_13]|nr:MAG: phosphate transport system regulatory protein PhoU [Euryarchaeota archaeon RBG_16_68_13]